MEYVVATLSDTTRETGDRDLFGLEAAVYDQFGEITPRDGWIINKARELLLSRVSGVDADKMHAWREALERHTGDGEPKLIDAAWEAAGEEAEVRHVVVERPPTEKPPLMQRLIAWLFRPLLDRIDAMLERQAAVERKLDGLLAEWQGGQPPTEES